MTKDGENTNDIATRFEISRVRQEQRNRQHEAEVAMARLEMEALMKSCADDELEGVMMRQGHMLNALLLRTLDRHAGPNLSSDSLALILRTQRECRQTVQALARVREANRRLRRLDSESPSHTVTTALSGGPEFRAPLPAPWIPGQAGDDSAMGTDACGEIFPGKRTDSLPGMEGDHGGAALD